MKCLLSKPNDHLDGSPPGVRGDGEREPREHRPPKVLSIGPSATGMIGGHWAVRGGPHTLGAAGAYNRMKNLPEPARDERDNITALALLEPPGFHSLSSSGTPLGDRARTNLQRRAACLIGRRTATAP